jgi:uncharacterized protein (DUF1697 family)
MRQVSFLHGINVGGHRKILMKELARLYEDLGFGNVHTYLNSGNVLYDGTKADPATQSRAIEERFGFPVTVMVRNVDALRKIVGGVPFPPDTIENESRLLVVFFGVEVEGRRFEYGGAERISLRGSEAYVYYPDGVGRSRLDLERLLGERGTGRTIKTVRALLDR